MSTLHRKKSLNNKEVQRKYYINRVKGNKINKSGYFSKIDCYPLFSFYF